MNGSYLTIFRQAEGQGNIGRLVNPAPSAHMFVASTRLPAWIRDDAERVDGANPDHNWMGAFGSSHAGVVNVALGDNVVRPVSKSIDGSFFWHLCATSGRPEGSL